MFVGRLLHWVFIFSTRVSNRSNEFSLLALGFKVSPPLNFVKFVAYALVK